jgi:molybdopterin-synthase adenylyltransferase
MLSDEEREIYKWQMWVPGFDLAGQEKLKRASVLISRIGGVGGLAAYQLAAAGIGKLVLAHAGNIKPSDLNRQLLMTHDALGTSRIHCARKRLLELNPRIELITVDSNVSETNVQGLVEQCDIVVDCAPIFSERFAMNREAFRQRKPIVECAMYEMEAQLTTMVPGQTACLQCLYPTVPATWKREFPVFGAVSGSVACMAAMEVIKLIAGIGEPLLNRMLRYDLSDMSFHVLKIKPNSNCKFCEASRD